MRPRAKKLLWIAPLAIVAIVLFVYLGGEIEMLLWNWLLPPLFGWHHINFWQALGILALCRILFGGVGWRGSSRSDIRRRIKERFAHMSPEEREQFRQRIRARCGFGPSTSESKG